MIIATTTVNFAYLTGVWLETYERFKATVKCGGRLAVVVPALDAERLSGEVYAYRDGEDAPFQLPPHPGGPGPRRGRRLSGVGGLRRVGGVRPL